MNTLNKNIEEIIHKILQEEIADRVIYESHLGEEALRRGLQSAESRLSVTFLSECKQTADVLSRLEKEIRLDREEQLNSHWLYLVNSTKAYEQAIKTTLSLITKAKEEIIEALKIEIVN